MPKNLKPQENPVETRPFPRDENIEEVEGNPDEIPVGDMMADGQFTSGMDYGEMNEADARNSGYIAEEEDENKPKPGELLH